MQTILRTSAKWSPSALDVENVSRSYLLARAAFLDEPAVDLIVDRTDRQEGCLLPRQSGPRCMKIDPGGAYWPRLGFPFFDGAASTFRSVSVRIALKIVAIAEGSVTSITSPGLPVSAGGSSYPIVS